MTVTVFCAVLFAAALHAAWNAIVKSGSDKFLSTVLITVAASLAAVLILPFIAAPAPASWPYLLVSGCLQVAYFALVAQTYHLTDMSLTYPFMRGSAPLLVALVSNVWLGERLTVGAWLGIAIICFGIFSMTVGSRHSNAGKGISLALLNALVIASYTLVDGLGVRLSGAPAAYTLWVYLLTGLPLVIWTLARRPAALKSYTKQHWPAGLIGGIGSLVSYGIALWAMTVAPIAIIAALRETAILFGVVISFLVLKEQVTRARLAAACAILAGAIALRLA
jgi:drug/metabolite transporter (DMT)-like permease